MGLPTSPPIPCFLDIPRFLFIRLLKIVPFYYMGLLIMVYIYRMLGYGPTWSFYDKVMEPCEDHLWTNLLFINNLYPGFGNKERMCLPWTWYMAVYMQLSLLTPFIIYFSFRFPMVFKPIHLILCLCAFVAQGLQIGNVGMHPAFDSKYWDEVYTKPWCHYNIQIGLGVVGGVFFNQYIEKRKMID